jgi:hypothetical protein
MRHCFCGYGAQWRKPMAQMRTLTLAARRAAKQRDYRLRYDNGGIAPNIEVSSRAMEALRKRAITYGQLSPKEAKELSEKPKQHRKWVQEQLHGVLEEWADQWL